MVVFHYHALAIQGAFRGYQSRKYNYNHARRKGYLQEVIDWLGSQAPDQRYVSNGQQFWVQDRLIRFLHELRPLARLPKLFYWFCT